ncbi:hypothetical protein AAMO2058_001182700 [Amorphochlora amoebiformis]
MRGRSNNLSCQGHNGCAQGRPHPVSVNSIGHMTYLHHVTSYIDPDTHLQELEERIIQVTNNIESDRPLQDEPPNTEPPPPPFPPA